MATPKGKSGLVAGELDSKLTDFILARMKKKEKKEEAAAETQEAAQTENDED